MTSLLRPFLLLLGFICLVPPHTARAAATPATRWAASDWRPCWLPGDPESPRLDLFSTPWHPVSRPAPGMVAGRDPVTGLPVRPSAAQRQALSAALLREARPDIPLPTERLPGGGELLHLPEAFQVFFMARRAADGTYTIDCTTGPGTGDSAGSLPPPPAPRLAPREER